jgi:nucleolar protein 15
VFFSFARVTLGPEWESSDEEENAVPASNKIAVGKTKKSSEKVVTKKAENKVAVEEETPVIYIGHLPSEFEELELKKFLSQFGNVQRTRLSRSLKTGNPKGYAFVQFQQASVAKIVAETLSGYFLGTRRLVCHLVPNAHPRIFYDVNKVITKRKHRIEVQKKQRVRNATNVEKMKEITVRLIDREHKKRAKLEALGIDYAFPGYEADKQSRGEDSVKSDSAGESGKKRKDSIGDDSPTKKKKQKDATDVETPSKRKDSVGSEGSASKKSNPKKAVVSEGSASKKSNPKEAVVSEGSASKKSKQRDSIGSVGSASKKSKQRVSIGSVGSAASQSSEKKKKNDKRRVST